MKVINGTLEKTLGNFILLISPLPAKVLFLNEGRLPIPVAHSEDQDEVEVTYFGCQDSIEKFLNKKSSFCTSLNNNGIASTAEPEPKPCTSKSLSRVTKKNVPGFDETLESIQEELDLDESFASTQANINNSSVMEEKISLHGTVDESVSLLDKYDDSEAFKETQEDELCERVEAKYEDDEYSEGSESSLEGEDY